MAMAALLHSVVTKMARAPPRLLVPTSSGGSRFSTSSTGGFTPSSANLRGPQNYNKEVPSGNEWVGFLSGVKDAAPKAAFGLVFGDLAFIQFYVIPALDHINTQMDAVCDKMDAFNKEMKQRNQRRHAALDSMGSQIEASDPRDVVGEFSKGQRMQISGQGKD